MAHQAESSAVWIPAFGAASLAAGTAVPAIVEGEKLVLWRSLSGRAHAWEDRCPHRGMRLSLGAVVRGGLACPYHGWRFGEEGVCNHVPAHPSLQPSQPARVAAWQVAEVDAYVWIAPSGGRPTEAPDRDSQGALVPPASRPERAEHVRTLHIPRPVEAVRGALARLPQQECWAAAFGASPGSTTVQLAVPAGTACAAKQSLNARLVALRRELVASAGMGAEAG